MSGSIDLSETGTGGLSIHGLLPARTEHGVAFGFKLPLDRVRSVRLPYAPYGPRTLGACPSHIVQALTSIRKKG